MKKRNITLLTLLIAFVSVKAQMDGILYTDFVPDTCMYITEENPFQIDINQDGQIDLWFSGYCQHGALLMTTHMSQGWEYCKPYPEENTMLDVDTLIWKQTKDDWFGSGTFMGRIGLRKSIGDQYCYGWMQVYCDTVPSQPYPGAIGRNAYVDRMAYCTIPNYPLRWGQTSLNDGIDETEATASATLHPNPTTGLVTITGIDLRQAEVLNTLGQRVATATGKGETMQVDLSGLPAGIYFVNVTDGEGRKCVRKVVKE